MINVIETHNWRILLLNMIRHYKRVDSQVHIGKYNIVNDNSVSVFLREIYASVILPFA